MSEAHRMSEVADGNERKQDRENESWSQAEKWGQMTGERNWDDGQQHRNLRPGTRWHRFAEPNCLLWESKDAQFSLCSRLQKVTARGSFALPQRTSGFFFLSLDCDGKGKTELSATPRPGWYVHTLVFNMYVCISYACREYYKSLKTEYLKISFQVQTLCLQIDGHKLRFWERWLWSLVKSLMFYDYLSLNVKDWAYYWLCIQCLTLYNIQKSRPAYSYNIYF